MKATARWPVAPVLSVVALPFLAWETWTLVAWIADGPRPVTGNGDPGSASWMAARLYEGIAILISLAVLLYLIRGCRRERRLLTFDVMFCLCGFTLAWADYGPNLFQPVMLMSSNFVNLTNSCGHMPFVVNPDCGRGPEPILLLWLGNTFAILGVALVATRAVRWARRRWPSLPTRRMVAMVIASGLLVEIGLEYPAISLHLWTYMWGPHWASLPAGHGARLPVAEILAGGLFFGVMVASYVFANDHGERIAEIGLRSQRPGATARRLLSLYAFFQLVTWVIATPPVMIGGLFSERWPALPSHLVNGICDAPGWTGTRYGPCPGSPGYRAPLRHSLPGRSP